MQNETERNEDYPAGHSRAGDFSSEIVALKSLDDFEVADNFPDPRGWDVELTDGQRIGNVDELMVDREALRTRYLKVKLDHDLLESSDSHHVLIPVGAARLDDERDHVIIEGMEAAQIAQLTPFEGDSVTREFENSVVGSFGAPAPAAAGNWQDFYQGEQFDDQRFYGSRYPRKENQDNSDEARVTRSEEELAIGKRRVQAGEVNVEKRVETEHVTEPVNVRREEVTVERRPATEGRDAAGVNITEDEITVPVTEEEVIVEKRPVVKEEIVIRKHAVQDTERVEADVKKERVEVKDTTRSSGEADSPDNLNR